MSGEIRLLVLNCEFPPIGGGAATATQRLLREFASMPVRATLVTAGVRGAPRTEELEGHCRVHYLPTGKADLHYWTYRELASYAVAAAGHVERLSRREEFDLCHAFFTLPAGAVAWWHRRSRPYIVSLRGSDVPGFSGRFTALYRALGPLFKAVWRGAGAVVANSDALKSLARVTAGDLEIDVIPNGVDSGEFRPGPWREEGRTLLTVARLVARKDVATPVRATAALAGQFPDIKLIVVGDGPEAPRLRELAESLGITERVEFISYVARERIAQVYRQADVFVLTSAREGMSNTVLEAIASGLPIVATAEAISGIAPGVAALVSPADAVSAAGAISRLLRDPAARRAAGAAAREEAAKYSWRAAAQRYFEVYQRTIAAAGRRCP